MPSSALKKREIARWSKRSVWGACGIRPSAQRDLGSARVRERGCLHHAGELVGARFFFLMKRRPPRATLFPYTPLCRSDQDGFARWGRSEQVCVRLDRTREENAYRSEEHTSELQSTCNLVFRLLLEK